MKKIFYGFMITLLLLSAAPQRLSAVDAEDIITDAQISTIRTHCTELLAGLNRLRQADTLLAYNRRQLYRSTADKLMVPLNQRAASNQLDGSELVAITAKFDSKYQVFFAAYRAYDTSLADALSIDCSKQPTTFYDKIAISRDNRMKLHDASNELVQLMRTYKKQFSVFKKEVLKRQDVGSEEQS